MKTEKFISCDCYGHGLYMDWFIDKDRPQHDELFITMFGDKGYFAKPGLWWRIKSAFKTLRKGWFPGGEVCLNPDKAVELKNYIEKFLTTRPAG